MLSFDSLSIIFKNRKCYHFQIVPFLSLGIGVDNMFMLLHNYADLTRLASRDEMGILMRETGMTLLCTSTNNILSFLAGMGTSKNKEILQDIFEYFLEFEEEIILKDEKIFFRNWRNIFQARCCPFRHCDRSAPKSPSCSRLTSSPSARCIRYLLNL